MPNRSAIGPCLCLCFLIFSSCGDHQSRTHQPQEYGEIPPGETWVAIDRAYQSVSREIVYYDPKTIYRHEERVTLWQLIDYKVVQGNTPFGTFMMSPHRFFSTKTHKELDCTHKTVRLLASSEFSQHMGTGPHNAVLVSQDHGQPLEPGSINQALWEVACGAATTPQ